MKEQLRSEIYPICLNLMEKGLEVEAYILILSTWNFAAFKFVMTTFNLKLFKKTLKKIEPLYRRLKGLDFRSVELGKYEKEIKRIYSSLSSIRGIRITGAPKLMHLKNPKLFVMWDNRIRIHYGFRRGDKDDYFKFLKLMQNKFKNIKPHKGRTLARTIDELNMNRITNRILAKAKR